MNDGERHQNVVQEYPNERASKYACGDPGG
jgi:hypothetical protein